MKINFVLPENGDNPIGGFKIIFQYANALLKMGNDVSISFLNNLYPERVSKAHAMFARKKNTILHKNDESRRITWFELDKRVDLFFNVIRPSELPDADVVIATAVQTANFVVDLSLNKGQKFYFIQNYEIWAYSKEKVNETFSLPMTKVVIAQWLYDIVTAHTEDQVFIVPNFLDKKYFYLESPLDNKKNIVSMLYHELPEKNVQFGLDVLNKVKEQIPDLRVNLFGAFRKPDCLPNYISYFYKPSQGLLRRKVYGSSKVYLLPSLLEGWGLTGMEAMASGAVLVASNIGGIRSYTENGTDSFLFNPKDKAAFVDKIVDLLRSENERVLVAKKAVKNIQRFDVEKSTKMLFSIFENRVNRDA